MNQILLSIDFISILRGLLGILVLIAIAWVFSTNRKAINWSLVAKGLALQIILALLILKVPGVENIFEFLSKCFVKVISFTQDGVKFLFASFIDNTIDSALLNFAVVILPTVIFFSALTSLLYYWGVLQKVVYGFAWLMKKNMKLYGA